MTDKIIFRNPGVLPLDAITTFGVNVKPNTENPIGHFGTGLKYALAVLAREEAIVTIYAGDKHYTIGTNNIQIRDKEFQAVCITEHGKHLIAPFTWNLPFTTELGKNWELWMAFRELYSNCMDEKGICYPGEIDGKPGGDETVIVVESDAFCKVLTDKKDIFIETSPVAKTKYFELHEGSGVHYKGVRIAAFEKPLLYRYNFNSPVTLTEDRTLKDKTDLERRLVDSVKDSQDEDFIRRIVLAGKEYLEAGLNFTYESGFGETFLKTVKGLIKKHKNEINPTVLQAYEKTVRSKRAPKTWSFTVKVPQYPNTTKEEMRKQVEQFLFPLGAANGMQEVKVTSDWEFPW